MFDLNSWFAKFYLFTGVGICVLFFYGALKDWKMPELNGSGSGSSYYYGRSGGGSWGSGK